MFNKCFLSGYLHEVKDEKSINHNKEFEGQLFLFDIEVVDVLKTWKGTKEYHTLRCLAPSYILKEVKTIFKKYNKGMMIIEGHLGNPDDHNGMHVMVDKIVPTAYHTISHNNDNTKVNEEIKIAQEVALKTLEEDEKELKTIIKSLPDKP